MRRHPIAKLHRGLVFPEVLYLLVLDKEELVHLLHLLSHDLDSLLQMLDVLLLGRDHRMALFQLSHESMFAAFFGLLIRMVAHWAFGGAPAAIVSVECLIELGVGVSLAVVVEARVGRRSCGTMGVLAHHPGHFAQRIGARGGSVVFEVPLCLRARRLLLLSTAASCRRLLMSERRRHGLLHVVQNVDAVLVDFRTWISLLLDASWVEGVRGGILNLRHRLDRNGVHRKLLALRWRPRLIA